jgi:hypothetical protein
MIFSAVSIFDHNRKGSTMKMHILTLLLLAFSSATLAQTKDAFETSDSSKSGIFDRSHFSMHNSVSFGMASFSGNKSNLQSQSLYSTSLQYQFEPVTIRLNFGLPIHSTISSAQNLNRDNIESLEYFKNMPLSATLTWQPMENMFIHLNFERNTYSNDFFGDYYQENYPGWYRHPSSILERTAPQKK